MVDRLRSVDPGLSDRIDIAKEKALDLAATARERFSGGSDFVRQYIVKEPTRALGLALGMGVILGWLIKRR
jgi:ElaB/YqjD/DUF883 family membrane-anchored ribosome-binding protein